VRVLLTDYTVFIGFYLMEELFKSEHEFIATDKFRIGSLKNIENYTEHYGFGANQIRNGWESQNAPLG
jgi:hypothetical protein